MNSNIDNNHHHHYHHNNDDDNTHSRLGQGSAQRHVSAKPRRATKEGRWVLGTPAY